jgi:hypothetical protein
MTKNKIIICFHGLIKRRIIELEHITRFLTTKNRRIFYIKD